MPRFTNLYSKAGLLACFGFFILSSLSAQEIKIISVGDSIGSPYNPTFYGSTSTEDCNFFASYSDYQQPYLNSYHDSTGKIIWKSRYLPHDSIGYNNSPVGGSTTFFYRKIKNKEIYIPRSLFTQSLGSLNVFQDKFGIVDSSGIKVNFMYSGPPFFLPGQATGFGAQPIAGTDLQQIRYSKSTDEYFIPVNGNGDLNKNGIWFFPYSGESSRVVRFQKQPDIAVSDFRKFQWDGRLLWFLYAQNGFVTFRPDSTFEGYVNMSDYKVTQPDSNFCSVALNSYGDTVFFATRTFDNLRDSAKAYIKKNNKLISLHGNGIPANLSLYNQVSVDKAGAIWFGSLDQRISYRYLRGKLKVIPNSSCHIIPEGSVFASPNIVSSIPGQADSLNQKWSAVGIIQKFNDIWPRIYASDTTFKACSQKVVQFRDSSRTVGEGIYRWKWWFGDGDSSTLQNPTHQYGQVGTYTVKMWVLDSCGSRNQTYRKIVVLPGSIVHFTQAADTLYSCKPVLLQPAALQWNNPTWTTPAGTVSGLQQLTASQTGLYIITNEVDNCASSDSIYVSISPPVGVDLQLADTLPSCKDVLLTPQASQWSNPVWQTPNGTVVGQTSVLATLTGKYVIQNNVLDCPARDSVFIIRRNAAVVSFFNQPDTLFTCKPVLLSPVAQPFILPVWETPLGTFANITTFSASVSGKYKVVNDVGNCANADSITVVFRDTAAIDFVLRSGGTTVTNYNITLKASQYPYLVDAITQTQALRFRWFLNGIQQNGNSFSQAFNFPEEGSFTIRLITTSADSCLGKAEKTLVLNLLELPSLVIPSLVTLNKDNRNDLFEILQLPFYPDNEIAIYNRWGKEVFKAKPYGNDWPPADLQPGTYFYRLAAGGTNYSGWVEVVR